MAANFAQPKPHNNAHHLLIQSPQSYNMTINFISPPDLAILLEQRPSEVLLIDIRTPGEFQKETIILSVCFNLQACDFVSTSALEAPTDAEYVFPAEALRFFRYVQQHVVMPCYC